MFKRPGKAEDKPAGDGDAHTSIIAKDSVFGGDLTFSGRLVVYGTVTGTISAEADSDSMLLIEETGSVEGDIRVPSALVNGRIRGEIHASTRIKLTARAEIDGDVHYERLELSEGCRINGNLRRIAAVESLADLREQREQKEVRGRAEATSIKGSDLPGKA